MVDTTEQNVHGVQDAPDPHDLGATWGVPAEPVRLSDQALVFLNEVAGAGAAAEASERPVPELTPSRLPVEAVAALGEVVGEEHVETGDARLGWPGGFSYVDLVRRRRGEFDVADAVVRPGTADEVAGVMAAAAEHEFSVVPYGGGTSVVGGLRGGGDPRPRVSLALDRMARVLEINRQDFTVEVEPGITGPELERRLQAHGLTLGHFPQSWERATIGGYVATRSAGQASSGYGRIDDMVEALTVVTPTGAVALGRGPASAAGPDLRRLFIGSEGALGVIVRIRLRVRPVAPAQRYEAVMFPDLASGLSALRAVEAARATADVMRLSDEEETRASLTMSGPSGAAARALERFLRVRGVADGCMAILGWEGTDRAIQRRRAATLRVMRAHGAVALGAGRGPGIGTRIGQAWEHGRFGGPYLRDALMDRGYLVETLETAASWSTLERVRELVYDTMRGSLGRDAQPGPWVMCHVSHVYETGASLYFTVVASAQDDPVAQWTDAKRAATDALARAGATVTHHHAVGMDHAPWMGVEVGGLGMRVLRAVKAELDPNGLLNPGVLIPK